MEQTQTKNCFKCQSPMEYKEGTSKAGKPYKMWKCKGCGEVEWVKTNLKPNAPYNAKQSDNTQDLKVIEGLLRDILEELRKERFPKSPEDLSQYGI